MVDWLLTQWPDFESIDPMDAMAVNEEVVLLDRTFLSTTYDSMMPIHEYGYWQADQDHEAAFRDLYRFMQAMAGDLPGYEDATRALFAGDVARFEERTATWPEDVRDHAALLAADAFVH